MSSHHDYKFGVMLSHEEVATARPDRRGRGPPGGEPSGGPSTSGEAAAIARRRDRTLTGIRLGYHAEHAAIKSCGAAGAGSADGCLGRGGVGGALGPPAERSSRRGRGRKGRDGPHARRRAPRDRRLPARGRGGGAGGGGGGRAPAHALP